MDNKTEAYYVTPPTMHLPVEGIRVALIGSDQDWIERVTDSLEDTFPTITTTFYHLEEHTKGSWEWLLAMSELADLVIIDLGSATQQELLIAFLHLGNKTWFNVPEDFDNIPLLSLLNTISANVFGTSEQLHSMLRAYLGND
jgi:hypothetical protein